MTAAFVGIVALATTAIVALAATATTIGVTATTTTTTGVALAATAAATDKRNDTGSGIAFQDRHRGCLGRPRYKTCGE
ncbi:MAG: hypothetical protein ACERIE_08790 [Methyloceanibacter sp.]